MLFISRLTDLFYFCLTVEDPEQVLQILDTDGLVKCDPRSCIVEISQVYLLLRSSVLDLEHVGMRSHLNGVEEKGIENLVTPFFDT